MIMNLNYLQKCPLLFDQTINRKERSSFLKSDSPSSPLYLLFHVLKLRPISDLIKRFRRRKLPQLRWRTTWLSSRRLRTPAIASSPPVNLSILFSSCVVSSIRICSTSLVCHILRSHSQTLVGRSYFVIVNQSFPM